MGIEYGVGGARTNYGTRDVARKEPGVLSTPATRWLKVPFDFANLPSAANAGADAVSQFIPAGSYVRSCALVTTANWVGGTSLAVGLEQAGGTDIDTDGLITAAVGITANLVTTNRILGRGAQVIEGPDAAGTAHIDGDGVYVIGATGPVSSVAAFPVVTAVGTFTAGAGYLLIEYVNVA